MHRAKPPTTSTHSRAGTHVKLAVTTRMRSDCTASGHPAHAGISPGAAEGPCGPVRTGSTILTSAIPHAVAMPTALAPCRIRSRRARCMPSNPAYSRGRLSLLRVAPSQSSRAPSLGVGPGTRAHLGSRPHSVTTLRGRRAGHTRAHLGSRPHPATCRSLAPYLLGRSPCRPPQPS